MAFRIYTTMTQNFTARLMAADLYKNILRKGITHPDGRVQTMRIL
ncbi:MULTISPECIES: hypothetical protein [Pacificibacter]|nr:MULTISPECIES: hypothetical protein [Pacificibacter]MDO6615829.1 hypothetical protein [Pacificibacter sp. 1_MG-2023]